MLNSSKIQFFISKQAAQPGHIGLLNPRFLQYLFLGEDLFPGSVSQHPAVHQCSVVGCADKDHVQGRLPFVFVVLKPEAAASAKKRQIIKELRHMCTEELPEYVQPVGYKFLDAMPMTPVGKFDYRKLETEITSRDY